MKQLVLIFILLVTVPHASALYDTPTLVTRVSTDDRGHDQVARLVLCFKKEEYTNFAEVKLASRRLQEFRTISQEEGEELVNAGIQLWMRRQ